jgi:hypothetical protein
MLRPIDRRLDRAEGARAAQPNRAALEAQERLALARTKVAIGAVVRQAMLRAGIDPARARCLVQADEAAALLAASGEAPAAADERDRSGLPLPFDPSRPPNPFEARILRLAQRFLDGEQPNFSQTSFAELFAWSIVELSSEERA